MKSLKECQALNVSALRTPPIGIPEQLPSDLAWACPELKVLFPLGGGRHSDLIGH